MSGFVPANFEFAEAVARGFVVLQALGAVQAFFDHARDRVVHAFRRRTRIHRGNHDARRRQPRILRDRQKRRDQRTRHENGQGDNPRKNRSIDEKRRHTGPVDSMRFIGGYRHSPTFAGGRPGQSAARGLLRFTRWTAPGFHASCVVHTIEPVEPRVTTQAGSRPGSRQSLLWLSELWKSRRWGFVQALAN